MTDWWGRYVGLGFSDGGRGPDKFDCWGLVRQIYIDRAGVVLPSYGEISARDLVRAARAFRNNCDDGWVSCGFEEMAVVLMSPSYGGRSVVHVGLMVDSRRLIHTTEASGSVVVPVSHMSVAGRVIGCRRLSN